MEDLAYLTSNTRVVCSFVIKHWSWQLFVLVTSVFARSHIQARRERCVRPFKLFNALWVIGGNTFDCYSQISSFFRYHCRRKCRPFVGDKCC